MCRSSKKNVVHPKIVAFCGERKHNENKKGCGGMNDINIILRDYDFWEWFRRIFGIKN